MDLHVFPYMQNRKRDTDVQNRLLDSMGEGEGGMLTDHSPGWVHETSAQTWCTRKTQRDWVEREVGGGIRMGNT